MLIEQHTNGAREVFPDGCKQIARPQSKKQNLITINKNKLNNNNKNTNNSD